MSAPTSSSSGPNVLHPLNNAPGPHDDSLLKRYKYSVCEIRSKGDHTFIGTGFLVARNVIMTCNHVIPTAEPVYSRDPKDKAASELYAVFYLKYANSNKIRTATSIKVEFDPTKFFSSSRLSTTDTVPMSNKLDYTIVFLKEDPEITRLLSKLPTLPLFRPERSIVVARTTHAFSFGFPDVVTLGADGLPVRGELKRPKGVVSKVERYYLHYSTTTAGGSSGSPIVNHQGDLIALHYRGNITNCDCTRGTTDTHCNAGIPIDRILYDLKTGGRKAQIETFIKQNELQALRAFSNRLIALHRAKRETTVMSRFFPIEGVYTDLVMIDESERKENALSKEAFNDRRIPTHETLYKPKIPVPLTELFEQKSLKDSFKKRAIIYGVAGVGKTTFSEMAAIHGLEWWPEFSAIILIKLRSLNKDEYTPLGHGNPYRVEEVLAKAYSIRLESSTESSSSGIDLSLEDFRMFLQSNSVKNALLILDGFDELRPEADAHEGTLKEVMKEFMYTFNHILITSRPMSVSFNTIEIGKWPEFEITGFDDKSIETYIRKFYMQLKERGELSLEQSKESISELSLVLKDRPILHNLVQIPINLTLACSLFNDDKAVFNSTETFSVTSFYIATVNWHGAKFLSRSSVSTSSSRPPESVIHDLGKALQIIAWRAMKDNAIQLSKQAVVDLLRESKKEFDNFKNVSLDNLIKLGLVKFESSGAVGDGTFEFIHLTFQEYFAAVYLANLYLMKKTKKAKKHLIRIKFDPLYTLTLWMTAGYLSDIAAKNKREIKALQAFFNDLFSEPRDLGRSYELRLLAQCFEECRDPQIIFEGRTFSNQNYYAKFIEDCVSFIRSAPAEQVVFNLLNRNTKLFGHERIQHMIRVHPADQTRLFDVQEVLSRLTSHRRDSPSTSSEGSILPVQYSVSDLLERITRFEHVSDEEFNYIVAASRSRVSDDFERESAILALIRIIKARDSFSDKAIKLLSELAEVGCDVPREGVEALLSISRAPQLNQSDGITEISAIVALGKISKGGQAYSPDATQALIVIVASPELDWNRREQAAIGLEQGVIPSALFEDAINALAVMIEFAAQNGLTGFLQRRAFKIVARIIEKRNEYSLGVINALVGMVGRLSTCSNLILFYLNLPFELGKLTNDTASDLAVDVLINIADAADIDWLFKRASIYVLAKIAKERRRNSNKISNYLFRNIDHFLSSYEGTAALSELLEVLSDSDIVIPPQAIDALAIIISDPKQDFRRGIAVHTIVKIARRGGVITEKVLAVLVDMIRENNGLVRRDDLINVCKSEGVVPPDTIDFFLTVIKDPHLSQVATVTISWALIEIAEKKNNISLLSIRSLIQSIENPDLNSSVRDTACRALIEISKREEYCALAFEIVEPLIRVIQDTENFRRFDVNNALIAMVQHGADISLDQIKHLIEIVSQANDEITQQLVIRTFGKIIRGRRDILQGLVPFLEGVFQEDLLSLSSITAAFALGLMGQKDGAVNDCEVSVSGIQMLVRIIINFQSDLDLRGVACIALNKIVKARVRIPPDSINSLVEVVRSRNIECEFRPFFAYILARMENEGEDFFLLGVSTLNAIAVGEDEDIINCRQSLYALSKLAGIVKGVRLLRVIDALEEVVLRASNNKVSQSAVLAIKTIAEARGSFSSAEELKAVLNELDKAVKNPILDPMSKKAAVLLLGTIAKGDDPNLNKLARELVRIINNRGLEISFRKLVVEILQSVSYQGKNFPLEALSTLIALVEESEFLDLAQQTLRVFEWIAMKDESVEGFESFLVLIQSGALDAHLRLKAFESLQKIAVDGSLMIAQKAIDTLAVLTRFQQPTFILEENERARLVLDAALDLILRGLAPDRNTETSSILEVIVKNGTSEEKCKGEKLAAEIKISLDGLKKFIESLVISKIATDSLVRISRIFLDKEVSVPIELVDAIHDVFQPGIHPHDGEFLIGMLCAFGLREGELSSKSINGLVKLVGNSKVSGRLRYDAVHALKRITTSGIMIPAEAMRELIATIQTSPRFIDFHSDIDQLAVLLGAIANFDCINGGRALEELYGVALRHKDWKGIIPIVSQIGAPRLVELLKAGVSFCLILNVCYLTGKAFFISEGKIFISDNRQQAEPFRCPEGFDIQKLQSIDLFFDFSSAVDSSTSPSIASSSFSNDTSPYSSSRDHGK